MAEDFEPLYSLADAVAKLDPEGRLKLTTRALVTEIVKGRLVATKIAGRRFVSHSDLLAFIESCRCPVPTPAPASSSSSRATTPRRSTSSAGTSADQNASAQQALTIAQRLKRSSPNSSPAAPADTTTAGRVIPMNSASPKS